MAKILILLGYGIFEKSNSQYKSYLDRSLTFIQSQNPNHLLICGGMTKTTSPLSEAASIGTYLSNLDPMLSSKIILEETSITTPQNLEFSAHILQQTTKPADSFVIICDSIRAPKVYYLALSYFSSFLTTPISDDQIYTTLLTQCAQKHIDFTQDCQLSYANMTIKGLNLDRSRQEIGDQIVATLLEIGALQHPLVDQAVVTIRKNMLKSLPNS